MIEKNPLYFILGLLNNNFFDFGDFKNRTSGTIFTFHNHPYRSLFTTEGGYALPEFAFIKLQKNAVRYDFHSP